MLWGLGRDLENWWMVDGVRRLDDTSIALMLDTGQVFTVTVAEQIDGPDHG